MKKMIKKIVAVLVAIVFVCGPILQLTMQVGIVEAKTYPYQTENRKDIDFNTEKIIFETTQAKFRIKYGIWQAEFKAVPTWYAKQYFYRGAPDLRSTSGKMFKITNVSYSAEYTVGNKLFNGTKVVDVTFSAECSYILDEWRDINNPPQPGNQTISFTSASTGANNSVTVSPSVMPDQMRIKYLVNKKDDGSNNSNNSNNNNNNSNNNNYYSNNSPAAQQIIQESYDNYDYSYDAWEPEYYEKKAPAVSERYVAMSDENKRLYIKALYRIVLGREADEDEIRAHMRNSIQRIAVDIILSEESNNRNNINNLSNEDFVRKLYNFLLQRDPDGPGLASHTENMDLGLDKEKSIIDIAQSAESIKVINNLEREINIEDDSKIIYYDSLYRTVLGRGPNQDDIDYNLKNSVQHNTFDVVFSPESVEKNRIYTSSNTEFVTFLYKAILGRDPDANGLTANVGFLNVGNPRTLLSQKFVESEEFADKRLRECKSINLDEQLRNVVYSNLISQGFEVGKTGSNTLIMYKDDFERVTKLDLSGKELKNINGLSLFTNLEKLIIQNNKLEDISELVRMTNLKYLNVNGCDLKSNVAEINSLFNLEELHIENNELNIFGLTKAISNCSKLQKLYASNNNIINISAALKLGSIKEIYADNNKISYFNSDKKLDALSLKNQNITISSYGDEKNIPEIVAGAIDENSVLCTSEDLALENCSINGNKIKMSKPEGKITIKGGIADGTVVKLEDSELIIAFNDKTLALRIQDQLGSSCKKYEESNGRYLLLVDKNYTDTIINLDLSAKENDRGEIRDISGLEQFGNLKTLNLNSNKVINLNKLSDLKNLETLSVRFNGLTSLDSVKGLTQLAQLDASNNSITDTKEIAGLTNLKTLLLSNNNIGNNLDGIKSLENLSTLSIANNGVSDVKSISSLDIGSYYASLNNISNSSLLTAKENVNNLDLKNNTLDVEVNGNTTDIPDIIKYAMQNGGQDNLELVNCKIENDKVVIDTGSKRAQIKVKNGNASDTVVNFRDTSAVNNFDVDVTYTKNADKSVTAKITSDTPIRYIAGWNRTSKKTEYTNTYYYNTKEKITVESIYGDKVEKMIEITNVESDKIKGLNVVYDNYDSTNGTVTLTISADEAMYLPPQWIGEGLMQWRMSDDQKTISKVFDVNGTGFISITSQANRDKMVALIESYRNGEISEAEYDAKEEELDDQYVYVDRHVSTIDKDAPECNVEYSTQEKTKGSVRVIIWADEDIELVDKTSKVYSDVLTTDDDGKNVYGISLYYPENTEEIVKVQDIAGNITDVQIKINNIDTYVDGLDVNTRGITATNGSETVVVKANEAISVSDNNTAVTAKVKQLYRSAFEPIFTVAGSLSATPIMTGDLGIASDMPVMYLSDTNSGLMTSVAKNNVTSNESGNELSMEVEEGVQGVVEVEDESNNTDVAPYSTTNIDKECPIVNRLDTFNDDGSITVTLNINEQIQDSEDLAGWTLGEDGKSLTKTFEYNGVENIVVKDLAGNETEYSVDVNSIYTIKYYIHFEKIENSSKWLVVIEADRDLEEVDGWEYLENKNEIAKIFTTGEKETLIINGINGGSSNVLVEVKDEDYTVEENTEENTEENNEEKQEEKAEEQKDEKDTTQSSKVLPQTGRFAATTIVLGTLVAIVINRKKKYNKFKIK